MTKPTSLARDSSRWDRKRPGECLRRTSQPRLVNVVLRGRKRHGTWGPRERDPVSPLSLSQTVTGSPPSAGMTSAGPLTQSRRHFHGFD